MSYYKTTVIHWFDFDRWEQRAYVNDPHGNKTEMQYQYMLGQTKPHYSMPAIPLQVKYDYIGCVNIDDVTDPEDPIIVWMYDSWTQQNV